MASEVVHQRVGKGEVEPFSLGRLAGSADNFKNNLSRNEDDARRREGSP